MRGLLPAFEEAFHELLRKYGTTDVTSAGHRPRPHFGGIAGFTPGDGEPSTVLIDHADVVRILFERSRELGVDVRHEHAGSAVKEGDSHVAVQVTTADGVREVTARYAVGCDGARSVVRQEAGIPFTGNEPVVLTRMGVFGGGTESLPGGWERRDTGWFMRMIDGRIAVTEWDGPNSFDRPLGVGEFEDAIERVTGQRVQLSDPAFLSRYSDRTALAERYRNGRTFLAGDAAHVHFPAGGQGLNLGMQDAFNLGWKLAERIRGEASAGLLDTYENERRPVAEAVLKNTQAQLALMRPGTQVSALRDVFQSLIEVDGVAQALHGMITGSALTLPKEDNDHPLAGRFITDVASALPGRTFKMSAFENGGRVTFNDFDVPSGRAGRAPGPSTGSPGETVFAFRPDGYLSRVEGPWEFEELGS